MPPAHLNAFIRDSSYIFDPKTHMLGLHLMCSKIHQLFFPALLKNFILFFFNFHTIPIILLLFFLPLLLQIIAGDNRNHPYILPAQNEKHRHCYINHKIDSLKFTKITSRSISRTWASTIVDHIKINTEIILIEQSYRGTLIEQSD